MHYPSHDPLWMHALLALHVTAGAAAFVFAPIALVTAKGSRAHRRWGGFYFWCMMIVAATALVMALWRPILFLALIAVFSAYTAFAARRVLAQKAAAYGKPVTKPIDWVAAALCMAAGAALVVLGFFRPQLVSNLRIPAVIFGLVAMRIAARSIQRFLYPPADKMFWWYAHLQGMIGSYLAAWTAFTLVTIGPLLPGAWWLWLVPISVGIPAIIATTAYYQRKFNARTTAAVS
ncbi:MAG TPA: hypothetical protein VG844_03800 [Terracidiphilus sp.]|nr:hypothetical protein [Terracidiphilus sp.]